MTAPNITSEELRRIADSGDYGRGDFLRRAAAEIDRLIAVLADRDGVVASREDVFAASEILESVSQLPSIPHRDEVAALVDRFRAALEPTP